MEPSAQIIAANMALLSVGAIGATRPTNLLLTWLVPAAAWGMALGLLAGPVLAG